MEPLTGPATLGEELERHGLYFAEKEVGIAVEISHLSGPAANPDGLHIRRVSDERELSDYAQVIAANWNPPDEAVFAFYSRVATPALEPDCPARFSAQGKNIYARLGFVECGALREYKPVG